MFSPVQWAEFAAVCVSLMAAWTSWKFGKIYNWLTMPAALAGITLNSLASGLDGFTSSSLTLLSVLVIVSLARLPFGAIKLLGALGALLGFVEGYIALFIFFLLYRVFGMSYLSSNALKADEIERLRKGDIPLGPMIFLATIFSIVGCRVRW